MSKDYLKYTDFEIEQDDNLFKINSDTVSLGLFFDEMKYKTVLDIGCNNGALLLYALKKKAKTLIGVEKNTNACKYATKNLEKYHEDFKIYNLKIQEFTHEKFDVIVCNPPFFEMNNVCKEDDIKDAMFEESLPLDELFKSFKRLLKDNGEIYMIYPSDRCPYLFKTVFDNKFKILKMQYVLDQKSMYCLRVCIKLKVGNILKTKVLKPLVIKDGEFIL